MSHQMPLRGPLTDLLLDRLEQHTLLVEAGLLVGDGVVPPPAGWSGTQPGQGTFVSSVTVTTGQANMRDRDTLNSRHASWVCRYGLKTIGAARQQADYGADLVRQAVLSLPHVDYELGATWRLTDLVFTTMGAVVMVNPTDQPTFEISDDVELWLDRGR